MTGARVNEIAQLLLSDVLAGDGVYYLNLESDNESGKKLKNANARRKIPLHSKLISLGFIDYVNALKDAGYTRLFPELKPHKTKGYGRPVSAWFNESLLAGRLKLERNRANLSILFATQFRLCSRRRALAQNYERSYLGMCAAKLKRKCDIAKTSNQFI